jgi:ferritin-like metal-binding protein YciE
MESLQRTLNEEGETDKKLTQIAESVINIEASEAEEDEKPKRGAKKSRNGR